MEIRTNIKGIPCIVRVTNWVPYNAGNDGEEHSGGFGDFDVLDTRGKPAIWLQRQMKVDDYDRIRVEVSTMLGER